MYNLNKIKNFLNYENDLSNHAPVYLEDRVGKLYYFCLIAGLVSFIYTLASFVMVISHKSGFPLWIVTGVALLGTMETKKFRLLPKFLIKYWIPILFSFSALLYNFSFTINTGLPLTNITLASYLVSWCIVRYLRITFFLKNKNDKKISLP